MNAIKVKRQIDKPLAQTPTTRTLLLALGLIVIIMLAASNIPARAYRPSKPWCFICLLGIPLKCLVSKANE